MIIWWKIGVLLPGWVLAVRNSQMSLHNHTPLTQLPLDAGSCLAAA